MARTGDRGGGVTRARIATVATGMFLEHGFDEVTVAQVAKAAGVSRMTVFSHFAQKEDLLLDRGPEAADLLRAALRERAPDVTALHAVRRLAADQLTTEGAIARIHPEAAGLLRTVAASPSLLARARALCEDLEGVLEEELGRDRGFSGDAGITAALVMAAWRRVYVDHVRRFLDGEPADDVAESYRARLDQAFDTVDHGVSGP